MRICFVDSTAKFSHVGEKVARGGRVTSLFKVSDYLSLAGHDVTVSSGIKTETCTSAGVRWMHEPVGQYDVLVANRGVGEGWSQINAAHRILWTHDLPHSGFISDPKVMGAFDCTVFMSKYAEGVWRSFYRCIGKSVFIPNGVDKDIFYPRQKHLDRMIFASAPNRGLDKLPLILDAVRSRVRDGNKYTLAAYSNLAKLHPGEGEDTYDYKSIEDSNVGLMDPVPQTELANKMGQAGLMILPSGYPEICSNIVLQSLASGTPVITTGNLGATCEWVKHRKNGMLTTYLPHNYMIYVVEMVRNIVTVLGDKKLHEKLIRGALRTKVLTWAEVGAKWERMLEKL